MFTKIETRDDSGLLFVIAFCRTPSVRKVRQTGFEKLTDNRPFPTFVTQNGQWPLGRGGGGGGGLGEGLSNSRFPWTKWDFCSEVKKLH